MKHSQLKELQEQAALISDFLTSYESVVSYREYCDAKQFIRSLIDRDNLSIVRRLLHERGIEL